MGKRTLEEVVGGWDGDPKKRGTHQAEEEHAAGEGAHKLGATCCWEARQQVS